MQNATKQHRRFSIGLLLLSVLLVPGCVGVMGTRRFQESRELIQPFESGRMEIESMNISPDGKFLAVGYSSSKSGGSERQQPTLRVWSIENETPQIIWSTRIDDISTLKPEFSSDGKSLISAESTGLNFLDLTKVHDDPNNSNHAIPLGSIQLLSKNGNFAATMNKDREISIIDVRNQSVFRTLPDEIDRVLAFSDSGNLIAAREKSSPTMSRNKETIAIWNISEKNVPAGSISKLCEFEIEHYATPELCQFSPDEAMLAIVSKTGMIGLWGVRNGKLLSDLQHGEAITTFVFSPKERKLAVCTSGRSAKLYLWDVTKEKIMQKQQDRSTEGITAVAFAPEGDHIYTGDKNGNIKKWKTKK